MAGLEDRSLFLGFRRRFLRRERLNETRILGLQRLDLLGSRLRSSRRLISSRRRLFVSISCLCCSGSAAACFASFAIWAADDSDFSLL